MTRINPNLSRRNLLKVGGGGLLAALAAPTLVGCSAEKSSSAATNANTKAVLPNYIAPTSIPKPDLAGNGSTVEPGYLAYPKEITTSVANKPGKGNSYKAAVMTYLTPAAADNPQIKAMNEAMGSSIVFQQIPGDQYNAKATAMLAGGQLPDLFQVPSWDLPARLNEGAKKAFADLNSKLSGDAISKYPNLAALPAAAWTGAVVEGVIHGVPIPAAMISWATYVRTDVLEAAGQKAPTSVDEMLSVCKALTNASAKKWAWWDPEQFVRRTYGLGNLWNTDDSGTLRYYWEMPAWKDALALYTQLYKAGYIHPDAFNPSADKKGALVSGQIAFLDDGFDAWSQWASATSAKSSNPKFTVDALVPFAASGGATTVYCDYPWLSVNFLNKKLSSDQIDELLGMLNFIAAPFGTKENLLVTMGVEGKHWQMKDGVPTALPAAADELKDVYYFTAQAPRVLRKAGEDDWVKRAHAWQEKVAPMAKLSPGAGLNVDLPAKLQAFKTKPTDAQKEVVRGRMTMDAYNTVISDWQKQYGDELRKLVQSAVDAAE